MVEAGAEAREHAEMAARFGLRDADCAEKVVAAKMYRATEGHHLAAAGERAHRERVQLDVHPSGALDVAAAARQRRRIEHDQIEALGRFRHVLPRFAMDEFD